LAPLRGLTDTPEHRAFLEEFVRNLILADEGAALTPDEDARLKRAIALQMRMPVELRSLEGVADMLGQRDRWARAPACALGAVVVALDGPSTTRRISYT
jgi:type IV secretory pathway VirB4 component